MKEMTSGRGLGFGIFAVLAIVVAAGVAGLGTREPTPASAAGITFSKTCSPEPVLSGAALTCTIVITNTGFFTAFLVSVQDNMPAGLTGVSAGTTVGSCSAIGNNVNCSVGSLGSSASATITITSTVSAAPGSTLTNTATFSSLSGTGSAFWTIHVIGSTVDLVVAKSAPSGTTLPGGKAAAPLYDLAMSNLGTGAANFTTGQTMFQDDLKNDLSSVTVASVTNTGGANLAASDCPVGAGNTLACVAPGARTIPAGASSTLHVNGTLPLVTPAASETINNPAGDTTFTPQCAVNPLLLIAESNTANNDCTPNPVTITVMGPDVTVVKSNPAAAPYLTNTTRAQLYKLRITNGGAPFTWAAGTVIVTDDLRNDLTGVTVSSVAVGSSATGFALGECAVGANNVVTCTADADDFMPTNGFFDVFIDVTLPAGTTPLNNPTSGESPGICKVNPTPTLVEFSTSNNSCNANSIALTLPDMTVSKDVKSPGSFAASTAQSGLYTLHIRNAAGAGTLIFAAADIVMRDDMDNNLSVLSVASITPVGSIAGTGTLGCSIVAGNFLTCASNAGGGGGGIAGVSGTLIVPASAGWDIVINATTPANVGTYHNPANDTAPGDCKVNGVPAQPESNTANNNCSGDFTVVAPDLTIAKTSPASVGGQVPGGKSVANLWQLDVYNIAGTTSATFATGQTIVIDNLPDSLTSVSATATVQNGTTGVVACAVTAGNLVTCTASGGPVVIPTGSNSKLKIVIGATTPTTAGALTNPDSPATNCMVDSDGNVQEIDEGNNLCNSDTETIPAVNLIWDASTKVLPQFFSGATGAPGTGDPTQFVLVVKNTGAAAAGAFSSTFALGSDLNWMTTLIVSGPITGCSFSGSFGTAGTVTCTYSGLAAGASATFYVFVTLDDSCPNDSTGTADSGGAIIESNEGDNVVILNNCDT